MDFDLMTKDELISKLEHELIYCSDYQMVAKIICRNLPRQYIYRLIAKFYRLRRS